MKISVFGLAVALVVSVNGSASASSNCQTPGHGIVANQTETDHGWMKANTTCRVNRQVYGGARTRIFAWPSHGHLVVTFGYWSYTPAKGFRGIDRFTFGFTSNVGEGRRTIVMAVE